MTAQMVEVDLRKGEYVVCVYSRTAKGVWVLDGTPNKYRTTRHPNNWARQSTTH